MRAVRTVELFHVAPDAPSVLQHGYFELRDPFAGHVHDVLGIVEEGDVVVIASEQQNAPVECHETLERRSVAEGVVPRLLGKEMRHVRAAGSEPRDVLIDARAWRGAEELRERTIVAGCARRVRVERGELFE